MLIKYKISCKHGIRIYLFWIMTKKARWFPMVPSAIIQVGYIAISCYAISGLAYWSHLPPSHSLSHHELAVIPF